jgi:chitin synthase
MELLDTANSGSHLAGSHATVAGKPEMGSLRIPSRALRNVIEHLPTVDRQRLRIEKYMVLSVLIPLK